MPTKTAKSRRPHCFSELSQKAKDRVIERWREEQVYPDWDDVDFLTETLEEVLSYEFGITVARRLYTTQGGKTGSNPRLFWETNPFSVEFDPEGVDLDELMKHGQEGCEYFTADAARLVELWDAVSTMDVFVWNHDPDWTFDMKEGTADFSLYDESDEDLFSVEQYRKFGEEIGECLKAIYDAATSRLEDMLRSEIDYHYSDEYAAELLEDDGKEYNKDGDEFDEDEEEEDWP